MRVHCRSMCLGVYLQKCTNTKRSCLSLASCLDLLSCWRRKPVKCVKAVILQTAGPSVKAASLLTNSCCYQYAKNTKEGVYMTASKVDCGLNRSKKTNTSTWLPANVGQDIIWLLSQQCLSSPPCNTGAAPGQTVVRNEPWSSSAATVSSVKCSVHNVDLSTNNRNWFFSDGFHF